MSDQEIEFLPMFAQEIIYHQRKLEAYCSEPFVSMSGAKELIERQKFLAKSAAKQWKAVDGNMPPRTMR